MSRPTRTSPARRYLVFAIAVFIAVGLIGVFWEMHIRPDYRAVRMHEDGDLSTLVLSEDRWLAQLYGLPAAVHDVARSGTIVVPDEAAVSRILMENLAQVDVVVESYDPEMTYDPTEVFISNETLMGIGVTDAAGETTPWVVVWDDASPGPRSLRYFTRGIKVVLMDERLIGKPQS